MGQGWIACIENGGLLSILLLVYYSRSVVGKLGTHSMPAILPVSSSAVSVHCLTSMLPVPSSMVEEMFVALLAMLTTVPTKVICGRFGWHTEEQAGKGLIQGSTKRKATLWCRPTWSKSTSSILKGASGCGWKASVSCLIVTGLYVWLDCFWARDRGRPDKAVRRSSVCSLIHGRIAHLCSWTAALRACHESSTSFRSASAPGLLHELQFPRQDDSHIVYETVHLLLLLFFCRWCFSLSCCSGWKSSLKMVTDPACSSESVSSDQSFKTTRKEMEVGKPCIRGITWSKQVINRSARNSIFENYGDYVCVCC